MKIQTIRFVDPRLHICTKNFIEISDAETSYRHRKMLELDLQLQVQYCAKL